LQRQRRHGQPGVVGEQGDDATHVGGLEGSGEPLNQFIWGLVEGGQADWGSAQNLIGLVAGAILLGGFVVWETRGPEPMLPLGLFRRITFSSAVTTQFLMSAAIFSAAFLTSQFFQLALGDTPLGTGLRFLPWTATPLVIAPIAGALSDKAGPRALVVPGLLMQAAGLAWIGSLAASSSGYASYVSPFVLAGVGVSMASPCVTAGGLNAVPPARLGKAAGTLNTMQQFGAVFGVAVVTAVFNATGSLAGAASVTSGYRPALAVSAGISLLGAIVAIGMRRATASAKAPPRGEAPGTRAHSGPQGRVRRSTRPSAPCPGPFSCVGVPLAVSGQPRDGGGLTIPTLTWHFADPGSEFFDTMKAI
jgi:MFS family permease